MLSFVHPRNSVKLLGYCLHNERLLLVYDLVTLGSQLCIFDEDPDSLCWPLHLFVSLGLPWR
jgi:hypothetical protein